MHITYNHPTIYITHIIYIYYRIKLYQSIYDISSISISMYYWPLHPVHRYFRLISNPQNINKLKYKPTYAHILNIDKIQIIGYIVTKLFWLLIIDKISYNITTSSNIKHIEPNNYNQIEQKTRQYRNNNPIPKITEKTTTTLTHIICIA